MRDDQSKLNQGSNRAVRLLQLASVTTIVFSIFTALDTSNHSIELFTHFRLQYFVVSLLLTVVFIFLKSPRLVVILLLTAIFNGSFIYAWYIPVDVGAFQSNQITVMHANVHSSSDAYQRLADAVFAEDPDIVFLQEVNADWARETKRLSARYPHAYLQPLEGNFGIAVFSKLPFVNVRHVDSPPFGHPSIVATVAVNTHPVTFVSSHSMIPLGRTLYDARNQQLVSIIEEVSRLHGHVVLLGDFNESIWGAKYRQVISETGLRDARIGFGILPSWPVFFPVAMIPIDHIFVSAGLQVVEIHRGDSFGSDHLPLVATLAL